MHKLIGLNTHFCSCCKVEKPREDFRKNKGRRFGLSGYCKTCASTKDNKFITNNQNKIKETKRSWYLKNKKEILQEQSIKYKTIRRKMAGWKYRAKRRKIEWGIDLSYLETLDAHYCYYTGHPLTLGPNKFNTISLDRVDNSLGYVSGNIVFCCQIVNKMKLEKSVDEFLKRCSNVASFDISTLSASIDCVLSKEEISHFRRLYHSRKSAALREGREWSIDFKFLLNLPRTCGYTGESLKFSRNHMNSVSIDRIDSSIGYTKQNTMLCCSDINLMKNSQTKEQFLEMCNTILKFGEKNES